MEAITIFTQRVSGTVDFPSRHTTLALPPYLLYQRFCAQRKYSSTELHSPLLSTPDICLAVLQQSAPMGEGGRSGQAAKGRWTQSVSLCVCLKWLGHCPFVLLFPLSVTTQQRWCVRHCSFVSLWFKSIWINFFIPSVRTAPLLFPTTRKSVNASKFRVNILSFGAKNRFIANNQ